ncbi:LIPID PHOSPHATE PHOSPHATASE 3, lipid phosphate phosphatase 3 [Hibiscus trionum]|uniref:LIPID PHOSPHATE PHOSPHATASE 3, lipid phosphate phosphatase 3 n=1 Tax=Hibiscus trionum TaxID=183268 RepID=A0A9W7I0X0_HIBTR|nr:LIPID PHOSPHATE PHOSPHATASE 3, lipid phosphate phosphatase 3 [Hibiscus trionum]
MASWNSAFLLWFKNLRNIFQDLSSKRVENPANDSHCLSSLDLPLIDQGNKEYKMHEVQLGSHTIRSHGATVARTHMHDWLILLLLVVIEIILYIIHPFYRFVGKDMMDDLRYPFKSNTVPVWAVPMYAMLLPMLIFLIVYIRRKDVYDLHHAVLGLLFSVLVTAVITDSIKNAVGRPRPDFFWRCFPDGKDAYDKWGNVICHGDKSVIKEGHKSFPSGHTSWSFTGLGFLSLYLSGKIKVFDRRGHVAKLCVVFLPLLVASLVGISRVDDYWHHWQDVFAGGLLGLVVSTFCYLQFFPPPYDVNGWGTYAYFRVLEESTANTTNTVNAGNLQNAMTGEIQIANQQEERNENGFMGMHLARDSSSTLEDIESGKS